MTDDGPGAAAWAEGTLGPPPIETMRAVWLATICAEDGWPEDTYKPAVFVTGQSGDEGDDSAAVHRRTMTFKSSKIAKGALRTLSSPHPERTTLRAPAQDAPESPAIPEGPGYHLIERIGEGGMGIVWRGYQGSLLRHVAIKQVRDSGGDESFLAEAMVTGFLDHPNIVPVHSLGQDRDGSLFMSMKLVDGVQWRELLHPEDEAARERSLAMGLEGHLRVLLSVCNAVAYAHSRYVIHRDLKPANVMIGSFGEVVVMDWGIALDVSTPPRLPRRTRHRDEADQVVGTPAYMAPEMALGRGAMQGAWTDVYQLGGLLYEILTGRPPHRAPTLIATLVAASRAQPPELGPEVPEDLARLCRDAMAREPAERIADVATFQSRLRDHLEHRESILLSDRAEAETARLQSTVPRDGVERDRRYEAWARVVARYEQALELYSGNRAAALGVIEARLAFGEEALEAGDLGLANAQAARLPESEPRSVTLRREVALASRRRERAARQARRSRTWLLGAGIALAVGLMAGLVLINAERARTAVERDAAQSARARERQHREHAERAHQQARALLAESLVAQADAMVLGDRLEPALPLYSRARERLRALGRDPAPAELGLWLLLRHATLPLWVRPTGDGPVRSVDVSWNGREVLSGGRGPTLSLWDGPTARRRHRLRGHTRRVLASALSPDGRRAVSGGADDQVRLWNTVSGRTERVLDGHAGEVLGALFTDGGERVLSYGADNALILWSADTGRPVVRLQHDALVLAAAVSADGSQIFAQDAGAFRVWEVPGGGALDVVPFEASGGMTPWRSFFLPGGGQVLTLLHGSEGVDRLELWSALEGRRLRALHDEVENINAFQLTDDGRWAVSGGRSTRLWDVASGRSIAHFTGLPDEVRAVSLSPDGSYLAAGDAAGHVALWARLPQRALRTLDVGGRLRSMRFAAAGHLLLVQTRDAPPRYLDVDTGALLAELPEGLPEAARLGVAEDGTLVTLEPGRPRPVLRALDVWGRRERSRHEIAPIPLGPAESGGTAASDVPRMLHLLPGGEEAWLVGLRGGVCRHAVESGARLAALAPPAGDRMRAGRWSVMAPSGQALIVGGAGRQLLWDLRRGRSRGLRRPGVSGAALDAGGEVLALAEGATITVFDVAALISGADPTPRRRLRGGRAGVTQLAFLHDDAWLVAGMEDRSIALWQVRTGRRLRLLDDERAAWPLPLASSAGRLLLASPGLGGKLLLWDFEHAERFAGLIDRLPGALDRLAADPDDPDALAALGDWYALRGKWSWALQALGRARERGADVDPLAIALASQRSGRRADLQEALREARAKGRAPDWYLDLALQAATGTVGAGAEPR